jgi:hypothetical protein
MVSPPSGLPASRKNLNVAAECHANCCRDEIAGREDDSRQGDDIAARGAENLFTFCTWRGEKVTRDIAAETVIDGLRRVLGIGELTRLRTALVKHAMDNLGESLGQG